MAAPEVKPIDFVRTALGIVTMITTGVTGVWTFARNAGLPTSICIAAFLLAGMLVLSEYLSARRARRAAEETARAAAAASPAPVIVSAVPVAAPAQGPTLVIANPPPVAGPAPVLVVAAPPASPAQPVIEAAPLAAAVAAAWARPPASGEDRVAAAVAADRGKWYVDAKGRTVLRAIRRGNLG